MVISSCLSDGQYARQARLAIRPVPALARRGLRGAGTRATMNRPNNAPSAYGPPAGAQKLCVAVAAKRLYRSRTWSRYSMARATEQWATPARRRDATRLCDGRGSRITKTRDTGADGLVERSLRRFHSATGSRAVNAAAKVPAVNSGRGKPCEKVLLSRCALLFWPW